jgi:hypothetical protein
MIWTGMLLAALVVAACSASDGAPDGASDVDSFDNNLPPVVEAPGSLSATEALREPPFVSDPALEALVSRPVLGLPRRFVAVGRLDREPILSLGLVASAARITYSSATTNEILSVDVLRLAPTVDPERFFGAFADTLGDDAAFIGVRNVGVILGIGDRARHITFTVQGDDGEAVAILRGDLVALATYRRPSGLRAAVEMGVLLERLDASLSGASLAAPPEAAQRDGEQVSRYPHWPKPLAAFRAVASSESRLQWGT